MPKIYGSSEILGDLLVTGSFSVIGSFSNIYTTNLVVSDPLIVLGSSQSSPLFDEGIMFNRGTGMTQALIWDESESNFSFIQTNDNNNVTNVNISSYSNLRVAGLTTSNITLKGDSSGQVLIKTRDSAGSWTATLPNNKGNISSFVYNNFGGEMMLNDGEGNLYFGTTPSLYLPTTQVFIGNTYSYAVGRTFSGDMYNDYTGVVTINNGVVSYVKMQTVSQKAVLGSTNVSGGVVTELPLYNSYITIGSASTYLENVSNWTGNTYTGPSITGTFQGQNHYDGSYFYTAVDDNLWIRFARV
jgi:hypothetical protein